MPYYLYECKDEKCKNRQEELRSIGKRDECPRCNKCGLPTERIFHPAAGKLVMWKHPGESGCLTVNGPTRKESKYTVGDVAKENDWYNKLGIHRE